MLEKGKDFEKYFTKNLVLFEPISDENNKDKIQSMRIIVPKKTNIQARLGIKDP